MALNSDTVTAAMERPAESLAWARVKIIIKTKATKGSIVASKAAVRDGSPVIWLLAFGLQST